MSARRGAPFIATCIVSAVLLGCDDDAERGVGDPGQAEQPSRTEQRTASSGPSAASRRDAESGGQASTAEMARIERAMPAPRIKALSGEQLEHVKKVKGPGGATYYITPQKPRPTATAAIPGCVKRRHPQPPGVTARRIGARRVLVTYRVGGDDEGCRAEWIELMLDVSDDYLGGDLTHFRISDERSGQVVLDVPDHVADADILVASTRTEENSGFASRATTIRIR